MAEADDIREITDLTANLARMRQKADAAHIEMTREMQTLAMDHAKNMRRFNEETMGFLRDVGAQRTYELREELDLERRILEQRMSAGDLEQDDLDLLDKRLDTVRGITSIADQYSSTLMDQARWMEEEGDSLFDIKQLSTLLVHISVERETLAQNIAGFEREQLDAQIEKLNAL